MTNELPEEKLGWYYIGEMWNLHVDGDLQEVKVDFINVDEMPEGADEYLVQHYGPQGSLISTLRHDADEILEKVEERETTNRPWHI